MPTGPGGMLEKILAGLPGKTGKTVEDWTRIARESGKKVRRDCVAWLMAEHGLGRVAASAVADRALGRSVDYSGKSSLVDGMFSGAKASLRPTYEAVARLARGLGKDVGISPCRTQVTFTRRRQIAWVRPATRTRIDLGLALPGVRAQGRLVPVAGTNEKDRVRLKIELSSPAEVDAEVRRWLKTAYDLDA